MNSYLQLWHGLSHTALSLFLWPFLWIYDLILSYEVVSSLSSMLGLMAC